MLIFSKITEVQSFLSPLKAKGISIGFVPTMGALHEGHLSLIRTSNQNCDITICSVFVNPTQFNDKSDLDRYPRMPEKDAEMLRSAQCDVLFLPLVTEIYPESGSLDIKDAPFDFGNLNQILEAEHRPGHFNGVAQVVKRFFEIVQPDTAFFGSKDYQQVMIVKALVKQMNSPIRIEACPILRESDGLAMSSRNTLLSSEERKTAALIPQLMQEAKNIALRQGIQTAKQYVLTETGKQALMKLDYYEVCDATTLALSSSITDKHSSFISLIAVFVGKTRLIDNLLIQ